MSWNHSLAFPLTELALLATCTACLLITAHTLKDALATHARILASGENHGANVYAWNSVRSKGINVIVQVVFLAWGVDRLYLLLAGYHPDLWGRWIAYGLGRTLAAVLIAFTAYVNMVSFRRLRRSLAE